MYSSVQCPCVCLSVSFIPFVTLCHMICLLPIFHLNFVYSFMRYLAATLCNVFWSNLVVSVYDLWNWTLIYNALNTFRYYQYAFQQSIWFMQFSAWFAWILSKQIKYTTSDTTWDHFYCIGHWTIHSLIVFSKSRRRKLVSITHTNRVLESIL